MPLEFALFLCPDLLRLFSTRVDGIREPFKPIWIDHLRIGACYNPIRVCADSRYPLRVEEPTAERTTQSASRLLLLLLHYLRISNRRSLYTFHMLHRSSNIPSFRTRKMLLTSPQPCDQTQKHNDSNRRTGVIHVLAVDRIQSRQVEDDRVEDQEEEAEKIER